MTFAFTRGSQAWPTAQYTDKQVIVVAVGVSDHVMVVVDVFQRSCWSSPNPQKGRQGRSQSFTKVVMVVDQVCKRSPSSLMFPKRSCLSRPQSFKKVVNPVAKVKKKKKKKKGHHSGDRFFKNGRHGRGLVPEFREGRACHERTFQKVELAGRGRSFRSGGHGRRGSPSQTAESRLTFPPGSPGLHPG